VHDEGGLVHLAGQQRRHGLQRAVDAVLDGFALVGRGFFSTQLITSAFTPGWPMPMRSRQ
jgi:hypothetical protein